MMKKIVLVGGMIIGISTAVVSGAAAQQVAVTTNGVEVILEDDGTWDYVASSQVSEEIVNKNEKVKDDLRYYIQRKDSLFEKRFDIFVDWNLPYDEKYVQIMEGFHRVWDSHQNNSFFDESVRAFGAKKAERILGILENWEQWHMFCR
ncbi:MAG: hypothetical protein ABIH71_00290 [Candidatus Omnitrophota bacterium]|nr:hypothetical protein [Candidatus Omnitrophota bacterium]